MAKQKIPTAIQTKFNRKLYKVGDYVYFDWLSEKQYGYITKVYQSGSTNMYMVQGNKYFYPCGVQIKTYKYGSAGYIIHEQTEEFGQDELKRRFESKTVSRDSTGPIRTQSSKAPVRGNVASTTNDEVLRPKKPAANGTKNVVKSSNTTNSKATTNRGRKSYSKLDEAIQKQKDFLRKFT